MLTNLIGTWKDVHPDLLQFVKLILKTNPSFCHLLTLPVPLVIISDQVCQGGVVHHVLRGETLVGNW